MDPALTFQRTPDLLTAQKGQRGTRVPYRASLPDTAAGTHRAAVDARPLPRQVTDMDAASRTAAGRTPGRVAPSPRLLVADRAVDLLRVSSALCTAPGRARRLG
ncbi:hypothetical protein GCM10018787_01460 [Streptomyces thermodiastaticus]|nr:hypothetical protein GCM10018787_01460 [Streptomyces thermodiastaticus]